MTTGRITLPYKIILKKLWGESEMGWIKVSKVHLTLTQFFRMGKHNWMSVCHEMKKLGYIESNGSISSGYRIRIPLKDLV